MKNEETESYDSTSDTAFSSDKSVESAVPAAGTNAINTRAEPVLVGASIESDSDAKQKQVLAEKDRYIAMILEAQGEGPLEVLETKREIESVDVSSKKGGVNTHLEQEIKVCFRIQHDAGVTHLCTAEVIVFLNAKTGRMHSPNAIGDHLGHGNQGLRCKKSFRNGVAYWEIPHPNKYPDWYSQDKSFLPKEYYGAYYPTLLARERNNTRSSYLKDAAEYFKSR